MNDADKYVSEDEKQHLYYLGKMAFYRAIYATELAIRNFGGDVEDRTVVNRDKAQVVFIKHQHGALTISWQVLADSSITHLVGLIMSVFGDESGDV